MSSPFTHAPTAISLINLSSSLAFGLVLGEIGVGWPGTKSFAVWQLFQVFLIWCPTCPLVPLWGPQGKDAFGTYPGFAFRASCPGRALYLSRNQHLDFMLWGSACPSSFLSRSCSSTSLFIKPFRRFHCLVLRELIYFVFLVFVFSLIK